MTNQVSSFPATSNPAPLRRHGGRLPSVSELPISPLGDSYLIEGTGSIRSLPSWPKGPPLLFHMQGSPTFVNSSKLIMPGGLNYTFASGDSCWALSLGEGVWRVIDIVTASGNPAVAAPTSMLLALGGAPLILPQQFGASGLATTGSGSISAGSNALSLSSPYDFANGHGVRVNRAGPAFSLNTPTSASVTPQGTTGSTTYTYTIAAISVGRGVGAAISNVQTTSGNATLSGTNYNRVAWTAPTGTAPACYAVYGRIAGSLALIGITNGTSFSDTGAAFPTVLPDWLPSTPQASALAEALITTIVSGGGTTSLTLANSATSAATSQTVAHDDTSAFQAAVNAAVSIGNRQIYVPEGIYLMTSTLSVSSKMRFVGTGVAGDLGLLYQGARPTSYAGLTGSVIACDPLNGFLAATTNAPVVTEDLHILYLTKPVPGRGYAFQISATAGAGNANTQSAIRRCLVSGADGVAVLSNVLAAQISDNWFINSWSFGVVMDSPNYPSYNQNEVDNNLFTGNVSSDPIQNTYTSHLEVRAGGDFRVTNNKFNEGSQYNTAAILISGAPSGTQNMEPVVIVGNTLEGGCAQAIKFAPSNASFNTNQVVITGNQFWAADYGILVQSLGSGTNMINDIVITGNAFMVNNTGHACIALNNTSGGMICGNTFNPAFGGTSQPCISLGTTTTKVNVQSNMYSSNFTFATPPIANSGTGNTIGGGSA